MYNYDDFDAAFVAARVEQFRDQVARRLSGDLTEEQFRPHRLMNGLYLQLHSYMLRVAIPYGTLNSRQMRKLAEIARKYDRGYGHFTTRQNIQYNWPALKDTPDILAELASVEMHAIQTSGNCVRNVTADHFAGVAHDEIADPRPYAEILRQWSSLHPEFSFLPRKFKIAVNGATHDRSVIQAHDIGLQVVRNDKGDIGFAVYVGGGLGRTPFIGRKVREFLPERDLLGYVEAILRVYNLEGRRDNKFKARIKILLHEKTLDTLRAEIETEFAARDPRALDLSPREIARIVAFFAPPELEPKKAVSDRIERRKGKDGRFASFVTSNVVPHRTPGYGIVMRSPISQRTIRTTSSASRTSRTSSCRMWRWTISRPSMTGSRPSASRRRTQALSPTSSPAQASTIARWRRRVRFRSPSGSPRSSATAPGRVRSVH
jgi:sulfite reductase (NADPH) hemoprotein beta-component